MVCRSLRSRYPKHTIFLDVDARDPGLSFPEKVRTALDNSDAMLVIIGSDWLRRLNERKEWERDWVRLEVGDALKRQGFPVVPVWHHRASLPDQSDLPPDLADLAWRDGVSIDPFHEFDSRLGRLMSDLERVIANRPQRAPSQRTTTTTDDVTAGLAVPSSSTKDTSPASASRAELPTSLPPTAASETLAVSAKPDAPAEVNSSASGATGQRLGASVSAPRNDVLIGNWRNVAIGGGFLVCVLFIAAFLFLSLDFRVPTWPLFKSEEAQSSMATPTALRHGSSSVREVLTADLQPIAVYCKRAVASRYPFAAGARADVALEDFVGLFGPGGLLDAFFQRKLAPLVDTSGATWAFKPLPNSTQLSSEALLNFQRAALIREDFFSSGSMTPELRVKIRAVTLDGLQSIAIDIDGQTLKLAHNTPAVTITWPGHGQPSQVKVSATPGGAPQVFDGPWGLFRMLDSFEVVESPRLASPRPGGNYEAYISLEGRRPRLEIGSDGARNSPFRLSQMRRFRCPSAF